MDKETLEIISGCLEILKSTMQKKWIDIWNCDKQGKSRRFQAGICKERYIPEWKARWNPDITDIAKQGINLKGD